MALPPPEEKVVPLLGYASGRVRVVVQAGDLGLVEREADDGPVALQQALALKEMVRAHALAGGRIAVRLLAGVAGDDQDLLAGLKREPGVDDPQHRRALALPG